MTRVDILQENLRSIFVAFGGDPNLNPPPDCRDTLGWWLDVINQQLASGVGGGGTTAWFATISERDSYYAANPDKLKQGISVGVGNPVTAYSWDGNVWITGALAFKGDNGRTPELSADTQYIKWRYTGDANWTNLIAIADISGEDGSDGETPEFRMSGNVLQYRFQTKTPTEWTNLFEFSGEVDPAKMISADLNNALQEGTDRKLFVPIPEVGGVETVSKAENEVLIDVDTTDSKNPKIKSTQKLQNAVEKAEKSVSEQFVQTEIEKEKTAREQAIDAKQQQIDTLNTELGKTNNVLAQTDQNLSNLNTDVEAIAKDLQVNDKTTFGDPATGKKGLVQQVAEHEGRIETLEQGGGSSGFVPNADQLAAMNSGVTAETVSKANSALQEETDPVYSQDKPNIALKSEVQAEAVARQEHIELHNEDLYAHEDIRDEISAEATVRQQAITEEANERKDQIKNCKMVLLLKPKNV